MSENYDKISTDKRNCEGEDNWCIVDFDLATKKLVDAGTGKGWGDFCASFDEKKIQFGFIKVVGVDERESVTSFRPKLVQINWVGSGVSPMKRMGALSGKSDVARFSKGVGVTMDSTDADDLSMNNVSLELVKAGAAHKPTFYHFGGEGDSADKIQLADVAQGK